MSKLFVRVIDGKLPELTMGLVCFAKVEIKNGEEVVDTTETEVKEGPTPSWKATFTFLSMDRDYLASVSCYIMEKGGEKEKARHVGTVSITLKYLKANQLHHKWYNFDGDKEGEKGQMHVGVTLTESSKKKKGLLSYYSASDNAFSAPVKTTNGPTMADLVALKKGQTTTTVGSDKESKEGDKGKDKEKERDGGDREGISTGVLEEKYESTPIFNMVMPSGKSGHRTASTIIGASAWTELDSNEIARQNFIWELIDTEEFFCSCLTALYDVFYIPMKRDGIIPEEMILILFGKLEELKKEHFGLLEGFSKLYKTTGGGGIIEQIGTTLVEHKRVFEVDGLHCVANDTLSSAVGHLCSSNSSFNSLLEEALIDSRCKGLPLEHLLFAPLQRLFLYKQTIKNLLSTIGEDPDHNKEYKNLMKVASFINKAIQRVTADAPSLENISPIVRVQRKIIGGGVKPELTFALPGRVLIMEGHLACTGDSLVTSPSSSIRTGRTSGGTGQPLPTGSSLYVVLFNDLLLLMRSREEDSTKYDVLEKLDPKMLEPITSSDHKTKKTKKKHSPPITETTSKSFSITVRSSSPSSTPKDSISSKASRVVDMMAPTVKEANEWVYALATGTLREYIPKRKTKTSRGKKKDKGIVSDSKVPTVALLSVKHTYHVGADNLNMSEIMEKFTEYQEQKGKALSPRSRRRLQEQEKEGVDTNQITTSTAAVASLNIARGISMKEDTEEGEEVESPKEYVLEETSREIEKKMKESERLDALREEVINIIGDMQEELNEVRKILHETHTDEAKTHILPIAKRMAYLCNTLDVKIPKKNVESNPPKVK